MSNTKRKTPGNWALPPKHHHDAGRPLAGRVIIGMLTGVEGPDHSDIVTTSANKKPSTRR